MVGLWIQVPALPHPLRCVMDVDLRVPLHAQRSVVDMVKLWMQASDPAPTIVMSCLLDARVSVGILVFGNPPFRRPSRPHHCLAP